MAIECRVILYIELDVTTDKADSRHRQHRTSGHTSNRPIQHDKLPDPCEPDWVPPVPCDTEVWYQWVAIKIAVALKDK